MTYRFLYINTRAASCSIYKSGQMIYNAIKYNENWNIEYVEINQLDLGQLHNGAIVVDGQPRPDYDVYIFNYHHATMRAFESVDSTQFKNLPGIKVNIILEMSPNNPVVNLTGDDFDYYLVMDPTMDYHNKKFQAFPRPLPQIELKPYVEKTIPVIGSFGYATIDKGFHLIVEAASKEFDQAVVHINIPQASYADGNQALSNQIEAQCRAAAKPGIEVKITHDFMSDADLIHWCSQNTINAFFYTRQMPGLAAATDQAIASQRPLAILANDTFRHIMAYQPIYPQCSLQQLIDAGDTYVKQMATDWSPAGCQKRLIEILFE